MKGFTCWAGCNCFQCSVIGRPEYHSHSSCVSITALSLAHRDICRFSVCLNIVTFLAVSRWKTLLKYWAARLSIFTSGTLDLSLMQAISCNMFQLGSLLHFFAVLLAPNLNWNIFFKEKSLSTTYQMFKSMDADIKWHAIFEERTFQVLFCNNSLNQLTVCCFCLVCTARGKAVWGTSLMI